MVFLSAEINLLLLTNLTMTRFRKSNNLFLTAITTEPAICNSGGSEPQPDFQQGLRAICDNLGIAFIIAEVITGFRVHLDGARACSRVTPELAIFAEAIASGSALSVFTGQYKRMQPVAVGRVNYAGTTNAGNPSIATALATRKINGKRKSS